MHWQLCSFSQLNTTQLFQLLKLRVDVFVVEQECAYPELDEKDTLPSTLHLLGYQNNELIAYARLLDKDISYPNCVSFGRVAVLQSKRGQQLGKQLVAKVIESSLSHFGHIDIQIGAQAHLVRFYQRHGFKVSSEEYLEDGIPHIDMLRKSQ